MGESPGDRGGGCGYIPEPNLELSVNLGVRVLSEWRFFECCAGLHSGSTAVHKHRPRSAPGQAVPAPPCLLGADCSYPGILCEGRRADSEVRMGWEVASSLPSGSQCRGGPALRQELCVAMGQCGWYCEITCSITADPGS